MVDYRPILPEGVSLPDGHSIDVNHPAYKALVDVAQSERWSQASLTRVLGIEARRVSAEAAARAAAPAAAVPAPKIDFSKMSTTEKFAYAVANSTPRRS